MVVERRIWVGGRLLKYKVPRRSRVWPAASGSECRVRVAQGLPVKLSSVESDIGRQGHRLLVKCSGWAGCARGAGEGKANEAGEDGQ